MECWGTTRVTLPVPGILSRHVRDATKISEKRATSDDAVSGRGGPASGAGADDPPAKPTASSSHQADETVAVKHGDDTKLECLPIVTLAAPGPKKTSRSKKGKQASKTATRDVEVEIPDRAPDLVLCVTPASMLQFSARKTATAAMFAVLEGMRPSMCARVDVRWDAGLLASKRKCGVGGSYLHTVERLQSGSLRSCELMLNALGMLPEGSGIPEAEDDEVEDLSFSDLVRGAFDRLSIINGIARSSRFSCLLPGTMESSKTDPLLGTSMDSLPDKDFVVSSHHPAALNACSLSLWCMGLRVGDMVSVYSPHSDRWEEAVILLLENSSFAHNHQGIPHG